MRKSAIAFFSCIIFIACNNNPTADNNGAQSNTLHDTLGKQKDTAVTNNNTITGIEDAKRDSSLLAGENIGKVFLGMDASKLENILGKPDMSDAAMGKAWTTWYSKNRDEHNNKNELNVYSAYADTDMRRHTVQEIRTTSSFFVTPDGIHVYSALPDIQKKYVVNKAAQYKSNDGRTIIIYDDKQQGIAFEIVSAANQNICIGIIIHEKGKDVNDIYLTLHPNMKRFGKE
jgi:hypothetical protein